MASPSSSPSAPQPPKESFARRYKFLWPMLLTVNLAVGAYLFMRTKKQDEHVADEEAAPDSAKITKIAAPVVEESLARPAIVEPVKVREPIPVDQQRELFKWILEEKRKIKPKDREEKKRGYNLRTSYKTDAISRHHLQCTVVMETNILLKPPSNLEILNCRNGRCYRSLYLLNKN